MSKQKSVPCRDQKLTGKIIVSGQTDGWGTDLKRVCSQIIWSSIIKNYNGINETGNFKDQKLKMGAPHGVWTQNHSFILAKSGKLRWGSKVYDSTFCLL